MIKSNIKKFLIRIPKNKKRYKYVHKLLINKILKINKMIFLHSI